MAACLAQKWAQLKACWWVQNWDELLAVQWAEQLVDQKVGRRDEKLVETMEWLLALWKGWKWALKLVEKKDCCWVQRTVDWWGMLWVSAWA